MRIFTKRLIEITFFLRIFYKIDLMTEIMSSGACKKILELRERTQKFPHEILKMSSSSTFFRIKNIQLFDKLVNPHTLFGQKIADKR